jgi:hypothetical protein
MTSGNLLDEVLNMFQRQFQELDHVVGLSYRIRVTESESHNPAVILEIDILLFLIQIIVWSNMYMDIEVLHVDSATYVETKTYILSEIGGVKDKLGDIIARYIDKDSISNKN